MTVKNCVENIRQIFPKVGETQVLKELDKAQKDFALETEILSKTSTLSNLSTTTAWILPSDCQAVYSIEAFDSAGLPIDLNDKNLTYLIDQNTLTFIDTNGTVIGGLPTNIDSVYVSYYYKPTSITAISDAFTIPEIFHSAPEARIFEKFYSRFPTLSIQTQQGIIQSVDWSAVKFWDGEYQRLKIEAKKYKNINQDRISKTYSYDFMGYPNLINRTKPTTSGTIIVPLSSIYSKYVRVVAISPSVTTVGIPYGLGTITAAVVGGVIQISSSAEFTDTMFVVPNQNTNYALISASLIEVYPPVNWGTLAIEIYES